MKWPPLTGMYPSQHMPIDAVNGASVVVICNLVARKMGGIESQARTCVRT